jgi:16S rRNA (guanine1516-N2)-methyltransferase
LLHGKLNYKLEYGSSFEVHRRQKVTAQKIGCMHIYFALPHPHKSSMQSRKVWQQGKVGKVSSKQSPAPLRVDFVNGAVGHRLRYGGGRGQDLAKAMGLRAGKTPDIIDATAGLGRDSFLLASLGAKVTMIERSDEMHALLAEGMRVAAAEDEDYRQIIDRMTLLKGDAKQVIPALDCHTILIDPMHPPRKSSALVRQELRQVRDIVGTDDDAADLVNLALSHATNRVVLKWPAKADPIAGVKACSHQIRGKSTRYDVFMTL